MTDEELIERLLGGCSCNIDTSPCMAEDDCRLDMEAARRICALTEQLAAAKRDAKEAEAYAGGLEQRTKWQPIETAPRDGTPVLLWGPWGEVGMWCYSHPIGWNDGYEALMHPPTHWMPLPEAPAS